MLDSNEDAEYDDDDAFEHDDETFAEESIGASEATRVIDRDWVRLKPFSRAFLYEGLNLPLTLTPTLTLPTLG